MDPKRHKRIVEIFHEACDLEAGEREAFLEEACTDDAELRTEVELLLAHDRDESHPVLGNTLLRSAADPYAVGDVVGPYRIIELLGEGGMGIVYLAEQEHPIKRKVALKLIKWGMGSLRFIPSDVLGPHR